MHKEGNFGPAEAIYMTTLTIISTIFYTSTRAAAKSVGTSSWLMTLIAGSTSIVFFLLLYNLMKRFPGKDLIEIFEAVLGKFLGKILALVFAAYFLYFSASNLREFLEMIKAYVLPYTPTSVILGSFIIVVLLLSYLGLECIARVSAVFFYPVIVGLAILLLLAFNYYDPNFLYPIFGRGLDKTAYFGVLRSSVYSEVVILAIIINSIHGLKVFKKAGLTSVIIAGIVFSISAACYTMTFEYTGAIENLSGIFQLSRIIYINRFFQRVETLFLFIWSIASIITVAVSFYISASIYCKTFKIDNHKPLLLPFSFLLFMIAILPRNISELIQINLVIIRQYSALLLYCVPTFLLIISFIFGKKGGKKQVEKE